MLKEVKICDIIPAVAVLHPDGEPRRADRSAARAPLEDLRLGRLPRDGEGPRGRRTGARALHAATSLPGTPI